MYKHHKIVLVNSASTCYGEFPLDKHSLLKASGNQGKSSILNALKFFWLAENTMRDAERKFKFVSKQSDNGFYSGDETFGYYFPTTHSSFIVLEAENSHGRFCQILHPRSGLGYGRIMVRAPYEEISDIFWNKQDLGEMGFGVPVEKLSTPNVLATLRDRDISFTEIHRIDDLKSALYSDSLMDDDAVFSIFPLKSSDDKAISDLSTILHTMLGFNTGSKELAKLFAAIIESGKKDESDHLNMDLQEILIERDALRGEEKLLNELEQYRGVSVEVATIIQELATSPESIGKEYNDIKASVDNAISQVNEQSKKASSDLSKLSGNYQTVLANGREWGSKADILKGEIKGEKKSFDAAKKVIERGDEIIKTEYAVVGCDIEGEDGIIALITEDMDEKSKTLASFEDVDNLVRRINQLNADKKKTEREIGEVNDAITNFNSLMVNNLPEHASLVMSSINPRFRTVTSDSLTESQMQTVCDFSSLFVDDGNHLSFGSTIIGKAKSHVSLEELTEKLKTLKNSLSDIESELEEFKNFKSGDEKNRAKKIKELREEIKTAKEDIKFLRKYAETKEAFPEIEESYKTLQARFDEAEDKRKSLRDEANDLRREKREKEEQEKLLEAKATSLNGLRGRLNQGSETPLFSAMLERAPRNNINNALSVDEELVVGISRKLGTYQSLVHRLQSLLSELVSDNILEDSEKRVFDVSADYYTLKPVGDSLADKFDQIEPRRQNLLGNKSAHKDIIAMKMQELQSNAEVIETYRARFNRMFGEVQINNLEGVKIIINLDSRFTDLVAQISANDLRGDEDISESFYEQLEAFVDTFFRRGRNAELTMGKIIKSVQFQTKKHNGDWELTGQSNSTTTLITVTLIQRMMREIMNPDIPTGMPIVIDELSHICESEIPWMLNSMSADGYSLLAASTNNISGFTLEKIGSICNLDEFQTPRSYDKDRTNVFFGAEGYISE